MCAYADILHLVIVKLPTGRVTIKVFHKQLKLPAQDL